MEIEWARHGQSEANVSRTLAFRAVDPGLTELGRQQAQRLAVLLASRVDGAPDFVACSPARRASDTAEIVASYLGLSVDLEIEDLREVNVGVLDGCNDEVSRATYRGVLAAWGAGRIDERFPGGESCRELCERVRRGLTEVVSIADNRRVLVVAHGANLRAAMPWLTGQGDPGRDLANGLVAKLYVRVAAHNAIAIRLGVWGYLGANE